MPASALLKFTQGATVGGDGRALVGVLTTLVNISNVNNSGVQSWQIDVAYADPTSAVTIATLAFNNASSTPAASFTPDVRRSFRIVLKVWDVPNRAGDPTSIDIRVFSVRELNGALIPPSMVWPLPLPDPRTGDPTAKPNEMNFDGQDFGWHGTGLDGLLNELLAKHMPPLPTNPGDVLTVVSGRWAGAPPSGGGAGDVSGPGAAVVADNIVTWNGTSGTSIKDSGFSLGAFIKKDGTVAFTGSQSMGGFKITSLANGTAAGDAVNLGQVQSLINGLDPKGNVRAFSNTNTTPSGLAAFGGLGSLNDGDRVGLGGNTNQIENGIWVAHSGAWTRPTDFNTGMDVSGAYFIVEEGTFADREFLVTSDSGSAVVGTNNLTIQDFGSSTISAGNGLQKVGNVVSILHDGGTLSSSVSGLKVATGGITGTELAVGSVDLASNKITGLLPFANIANGAASSVFGRSAATSGVMASITSSADGQVLRRGASGVLAFGAVDLADTDAVTGLLPFANLANLTGLSVLGRSTTTSGVMAAITGTADQVLAVNTAGTALAFGQVQTGGIATSAVTLAKLANATASSVLGRSAATVGAYADITSSADGQVLRRGAAGVVAFGAVDLADTDAVTGLLPFANIADGAATSVFGRSGATSGVQASIAASADGQVLQRVAGVLSWAALTVGTITGGSAVGQVLINTTGNVPAWGAVDLADTDAVTGLLPFANIANGAANSLLGRAAGTSGVMASIGATADGQAMRMAGGALAFGAIDLADADAVTGLLPFANLANLTGLSVLGRSAATSGVMAAITGAADQVLVVNSAGTALAFGTIATAGLTNGSVTLAKLANGSAASVLGRSAATSGVYADIASTTDGQTLRRAAGVVGWGALDLADADAVTGLLPGTNVNPNFGTSAAIVGGTLSLGTTPSTSGTIRLANSAGIAWRNSENTGDIQGITVDVNEDIIIGQTATPMQDIVFLIPTGRTFDFRVNGTTEYLLSSTSFDGNQNDLTGWASISLGATPATSGSVRLSNNSLIRGRNAANSADLDMLSVGSADAITLGASGACAVVLDTLNVLLRPNGTDRVQVTDTVFEWRLATVRFDTAVVGPVIQQESDATAAVTGDAFIIQAQSVTGTGATVGGGMFLRGGDSTNGTGGALDIRSGTGLTGTQSGSFIARVGSTVFLTIAGTEIPSTTGHLRLPTAAVISGRNNANTANISLLTTNSSDGVFVGDTTNSSSLSLQTSGARMILGTNIEIQNSSQFRFDVAVATPSFIHEDDATAAVTGDTFLIQAQKVTGTGATVGGKLSLYGGDSTNGTGGALDLRSGTGATSTTAGAVTIGIGTAIVFSYPGTVVPATSGILRSHHNATILAGRDSGNTTNAAIVRWGSTATDKVTFGNTSFATEVLGSNVAIGDGSVYFEVAVLTSNREILSLLLGTALTTTEMPSNTGDKVVFWANASTSPTAAPSGGTILSSSSVMGMMSMGEGGVEVTIAPRGSGTSRTRKFVNITKQGSVTATVAAGVVVVVTLSAADISAAAFASGTVMVSINAVAREAAGSNYSYSMKAAARVVIGAAGFVSTLQPTAYIGAVDNTVNEGPLWALDVTSNTLRLTADASTRDMICFATITIDGDTDS